MVMSDRNQELFENQVEKLERLRAAGIDPYPTTFKRSHTTAQAIAALEQAEAAGEAAGPVVTTAGRMAVPRRQGKLTFIDLNDSDGRIQAMLTQNRLGADEYALLK